jgi:hypothetical protein
VEGLHVVGDILTKISVNCVINLHAALLFMCIFLWVYPMRDYNCLYVMGISCIFCMPMFIFISLGIHVFTKCMCLFMFTCKSSTSVLCTYVLIPCS